MYPGTWPSLALQLFLYWLQAFREWLEVFIQLANQKILRILGLAPCARLLSLWLPWLSSYLRSTITMNLKPKPPGKGSRDPQKGHPKTEVLKTTGPLKKSPPHCPESLPLPPDSLESLFDPVGRLDIPRLRRMVYQKGPEAGERKLVWKFLFGVYPPNSTAKERQVLDTKLEAHYHGMKWVWRGRYPSAVRLKVLADEEFSMAIDKYEVLQTQIRENASPLEKLAENSLQCHIFNDQLFTKAQKHIDADVPRTDRHRSYFQEEGLVKLLSVREILITYAAFHQDLGYCQGMNDFVSRFLETLDSETDAFWCFVGFMRWAGMNFTAEGIKRKIHVSEELLRYVDPELSSHIERVSKEKLLFCLRWLLLCFQRDLQHQDALRVLEIRGLEGGKGNSPDWQHSKTKDEVNGCCAPRKDLTFDVLLCVAILVQNRDQLLSFHHAYEFLLFSQRLQGKLKLNTLQEEEKELSHPELSSLGPGVMLIPGQ
ncbi:TBC1 domain family member 15-like isoform X2 [Phascolarctos cinereus]|uniref:TBC1 domain family member 15-like isoform X2 n=1 Tax=Phascolarctos cinereus TaxID=38626 RepID=A0A6P5ISL4_PHACI|nr:TBC1 domain family member 15-like isoform X2 [Phascolarctos cinereus]